MSNDEIWAKLEDLERRFSDIHRPVPNEREVGILFIQALLKLHEEIEGVRAIARSR